MTHDHSSHTSQTSEEWHTLQQCHEQHEKNALWIKLVCVALCVVGLGLHVARPWLAWCVVLLWMQEAIFKTYQSRIADRLQKLERILAQGGPAPAALQLHTEWAAQRPGWIGLVSSYARSGCKPTVAFPYAALLIAGAMIPA